MVLGWDFEYTDDNGNTRYTSTSARLLNEAAYPLRMHDFINGIKRYPDISPDLLFVNSNRDNYPEPEEGYDDVPQPNPAFPGAVRKRGRIVQLKGGYGFISTDVPGKNLFFYTEQLRNCDFNDLMIGDLMEYEPGFNDRGECCKNIELIAHPERNS